MIGRALRWHTNANLLQRGAPLHRPYTKAECFLASLFPVVVIFVMVGMIVYQTQDEGKTQYIITTKTSNPHWRISDSYFEHMHSEIAFQIQHGEYGSGTTTLHQYYEELDSHSIYDNSAKIVNISAANGNSSTATLRYHPWAVYDGHNHGSGIVLCHDPSDYDDLATITLVWNNDTGKSNGEHMSWALKANTTLTVTFQLYINTKGAGLFNREWEDNELEIVNIEESSYPTAIPGPNNDFGSDTCYGMRVMQNRMVYEILDGFDASNFFSWLAATAGSVYTFMLGMFVCCAGLMNKVMPKEEAPRTDQRIVVHHDNDDTV